MMVTVSVRTLKTIGKLGVNILILAILFFYVLPKLLNILWFYPEIKIRNEHQIGTPMRVQSSQNFIC
jgi:hypothetical protein